MRCDLTDARLRATLPPERGRIELTDTRQRNLVLRIGAGHGGRGNYDWSVATRTKTGAKTRISLGKYPEVGIAEARKRARSALAAIADGGDPMAERRAAKAARIARAQEATVAERFNEWRAAKELDWSARYAGEVARIGKVDIIPALGKRLLRETARADWSSIIGKKRKTAPAMASLLYRVCSAFLGHAEAVGWVEMAMLPRKGLATLAPAVAPRKRVLSDDELKAVWAASTTIAPKMRVFIRLLVLTAARAMEVADIAIGEVDLDAARWQIPEGRAKNHQAISLPLGAVALAELAVVWPKKETPPEWMPLRVRGFSKLKTQLDEASGVSGWRWHDLRRTARTGMTRLGVPRDHAEATLNHVSGRSQLERTYDRHDYADEIIAASLRWQRHVESLVTPPRGAEPLDNITPLRRGKTG